MKKIIHFKKAWLLVLLIVLYGLKCKKDENAIDILPQPTETGANTFGFMLGGKVWVPQGNAGGIMDHLHITFNLTNNGNFVIRASKFKLNEDIYLGIRRDFNNYDVPFSVNLGNRDIARVQFNGPCTYYNDDPDASITGELFVTKFDTNQKIMAGTFYMTISKSNCETLKITDGRFDIKYGY